MAIAVTIVPYGKADFVRRRNPATGRIEQICSSGKNIDISESGCPAQVIASLLPEVVLNNGRYYPENKEHYYQSGLTDNRCTYCYARDKNIGPVGSRVVNETTKKRFKQYFGRGKGTSVARFGKLTEPAHPIYYNALMGALKLCEEYEVRAILTTKTLAFGLEGAVETSEFTDNHVIADLARAVEMDSGEKIAEALIKARTSLIYGIVSDKQQPGLTSQGFTHDWVIKQALRFQEAGVNVSLTLTAGVPRSFEDNEKNGIHVYDVLDLIGRINVRILPLRPNKKVAPYLCGGSWKDILGGACTKPISSMEGEILEFERENGRHRVHYMRKQNNEAVPLFFHEDFQKLVNQGIGVCGRVGCTEYCDKCNLDPKKPVRIQFPISQLVPVDYVAKNPKRTRKKQDRTQRRLFSQYAKEPIIKVR